ncbi:MAG: hypothetical protein HFG22_14125 [Lachnospiraceae bacterium]|nr:hypothetical protein [Lachnospiraceae bacterium]
MEINQEMSLETEIPFQSVTDLRLHWEVGQHATMGLYGGSKSSCQGSEWERDHCGSMIKLLFHGGDGRSQEDILFHGVVQAVDLIKDNGIGEARVQATSASVFFDKKDDTLCRAFTDPDQSYQQVARQIVGQRSGSVICTIGQEKIKRPLICYRETPWGFLKRIASHHAGHLIPDIKTGRPAIWFGMRKGKLVEEEIRSSDLGVEIKKTYTGSGKGVGKKIYRWTSRHSYLLGDIVRLDGMRYIIWAMDAVFRGGELLFTYKLAEEAGIQTPISYNESFTGMSLWGKVEEVRDEKVRVTFDFDPEKGKYFYPWMPETGNASYAVPEVGARVAVYFKDHDEREGIAVRCMVQTERQEKPEEKLLRSPDGSIVMMTDHHLKMQAAEEMMRMMDHSKIDIKGDRIEVDAAGKIRIKAERISLSGALGIRGTAG